MHRGILVGAKCILFVLALACLVVWPASSQAVPEDKGLIIVFPENEPDLEITSFEIKGRIRSFSTITINWSVRNTSKVSASGPWADCLYGSLTRSIGRSTSPLHCVASPRSLPAAKGYSRSVEFTLPSIADNTYYFFLVVDEDNDVAEDSEDNNQKMFGPVVVDASGTLPRLVPEWDRLYVSRDTGDDDEGMGTISSPLATLQSAITHASTYATSTRTIDVYVGAGIYDDAIVLPDNVVLKGANPFNPGETIIRPSFSKMKGVGAGIVVEGDGATIRDLTIEMDPATPKDKAIDLPLLKLEDARARLDNVVIRGADIPGTMGIHAQYSGANDTTVTRCTFDGLDTAIFTQDAALQITRNVFENMHGPVIIVGDEGIKGGVNIPMLGIASDPATGHNVFRNITGPFLYNQTDQVLRVEMNDWGGLFGEELDDLFDGPADGDPGVIFISFRATAFVSVLDEETHEPIYNASVTLSPSAQPAITENEDGVYLFSLLPAGNYTISATAPGHYPNDINVAIAPPNVTVPVTLYLPADGTLGKSSGPIHQSDSDESGNIGLSELLRSVQLYNAAQFRCLAGTEDGYAPGQGDTASCDPHAADFAPNNWRIHLSELLRVIQLFTLGEYTTCEDSEDGFCAA